MLSRKSRIIVGLTTYDNELLALSVGALSRISEKFTLVVYNDNPATSVTRTQIRNLGYRGPLYIINGEYNNGLLAARMAIVNFISASKINPEWFIFVDDDDILLNLSIPDVGDNVFAIIQNRAVVRNRLVDVFRAALHSPNLRFDDENISVIRPYLGLSGMLVRFDALLETVGVLAHAHSEISDIDMSLTFLPPVDRMMWSALNIVARNMSCPMLPIYMDSINYVATDMDSGNMKYGMPSRPSRNCVEQIERAIARYDAVICTHVASDCADAAPMGQD